MRISKNIGLGSSALLAAAGLGVAVESPSVIAHADTGHTQNTDKTPSVGDNTTGDNTVKTIDDAYNDIQGDSAHDTSASQHTSQSWEYMSPGDAAKDWQHKEDWEKEPGTDNTQTDWAIAQNTNGKTSVDTSADVSGDVATGAFNPGDTDPSKMTSLKWVDRDHDGDGEEEWVEGPDDTYYLYNRGTGLVYDLDGNEVDGSLAALIVNNNNNNNNNNSSNNNSSNNNDMNNALNNSLMAAHAGAGNGASGSNGSGSAGNGTGSNGQFNNATAVKQIGQNIEGNDHNMVGQPLVINGGNASGLVGDGNGTYVIGADGVPILVDNNNNNNNNNNGNNGNNNNGNNGNLSNLAANAGAGKGANNSDANKDTKAADPAKSADASKAATTDSKDATKSQDPAKDGKDADAKSATDGSNAAQGSAAGTTAATGTATPATGATSAVAATDGTGAVAGSVGSATLPQTGDDSVQIKSASAVGGIVLAALSAYGYAKRKA